MSLETGNSSSTGRPTVSNQTCQLSLQFVGGLCAGRETIVQEKTAFTFGRGEECDVILDGETVSRVHCQITRVGNAFLLEDASRNGTFVNGERISSAQLRDNDQVRIGQNIVLIRLSSNIGTAALTSKNTTPQLSPYLLELKPHIVIKGLEAGVTQPFDEARITIGRRADNHLMLDSDNISRQHLCIERRDEYYFAVDLGSANGTYLNDERVESAQLKDGDCLRIGDFTLTVRMRGQDCILNFKKITR